MPLLNKKRFEKNIIPAGLKDTDKVFYCDVTNEIFDNYQEFAERIILCNSLVWACEETGKSGLTYIEAMECEKNAKKILNDFPIELRRPILYLVTLTSRSALSDLTEDIFAYVRERYFVSELLEYNAVGDQWISARVLQVTMPTSKELADLKNGVKSNEKHCWPPGSLYHYEVELLARSEGDSKAVLHVSGSKLRRKKSTYTRDRNHLFVKHFVCKVDGVWKLKGNAYKRFDIGCVQFDEIFAGHAPKFQRSDSPKKTWKKSSSTVATATLGAAKSPYKNGVLTNGGKMKKQESIDKYLKPKMLDKDYRQKSPSKRGAGSTTAFNGSSSESKTKSGIVGGKDVRSGSKQLHGSNIGGHKKSAVKRKSTEEILERELLEKRKKMMEHQQQLIEKKQQKQLDIQRKRDEKKKLEEFVKEWNKTREDLELEDLKELPDATVVGIGTPNEYFGQIVMLYEFFRNFCDQLNVKNFFPAGLTIDLLDRALSRRELAGPLCDIIHLLLSVIFRMQEEEEDEVGESYDSCAVATFDNVDTMAVASNEAAKSVAVGTNVVICSAVANQNDDDNDDANDDDDDDDDDGNNVLSRTAVGIGGIDVATVAVNWPLAFHGVPLPKLPVDATTISEVLRLHLLSSGCRVSETCSRWRAQEKGGYISSDDPAVFFRKHNAHIIRTLSERNVAALSVGDKITVLECLVNQITMYSGIRNIIHENVETYRQRRVELRLALAAEMRKEKEITQKKKDTKLEKSGGNSASGVDAARIDSLSEKSSGGGSSLCTVEMLEKQEKEMLKKKEELRKQLIDLTAENMKVQLAPLGVDRAYRRFWLFPSIPGIFVEDNELHPPACLPRGTPAPNIALMKEKDTLSYVRKLFQKEYNKENLGVVPTAVGSPKKTNGVRFSSTNSSVANLATCGSANGACSGSIVGGLGGNAVPSAVVNAVVGCCVGSGDGASKEEPNKAPFTCWGDSEMCPVHCSNVPRVRWSYYQSESDYENLINALNTRGKRESKLRAMLIQHRDVILKGLNRPSLHLGKLSAAEDGEINHAGSIAVETRKSSRGNPTYDDTMLGYLLGDDVEHALEAVLREAIEDIEERSNAGGLGCLRVFDRDSWVKAIKDNSYVQSCDKLVWGPTNDENTEDINKDPKFSLKCKKYSNLEKFKILRWYAKDVNPKVKELARAILQLEQSIELHYLKPPLGAEKNKPAGKAGTTELLRRWESSLMSCTSFAQLFLHLYTLENSIAWNRSAQNAYCRICRRRGDAQNMLLCDSCNKGHHLYCLKPKLTKIPKGDWHCHHCKPPPKEPSLKKKPTVYLAESDEDLVDKRNSISVEKMELCCKGKCKVCNEKGATIGCSKCMKRYHLACLIPPLRKPPTINWSCHSCRRISAKKEENRQHFVDDPDELSSYSEPSRTSRRKTSKAANEKIYRFVKKLRTPNSSDEDEYDENNVGGSNVNATTTPFATTVVGMMNGYCRRRRTRHSIESNYTSQLPLDNATLQEMLDKIMHHEDAWPFLRPVSRYEAADYAEIIKRPMDFATIKHKLNMLQYHTNSQVISDSILVFSNCFLYNKDSSDVHKAGVRLLEYFKMLCRELNFEKELLEAESQSNRLNADEEIDNVEEEMEEEDTVEDEEDGEEQEEEEEDEVGAAMEAMNTDSENTESDDADESAKCEQIVSSDNSSEDDEEEDSGSSDYDVVNEEENEKEKNETDRRDWPTAGPSKKKMRSN